ncbi:hypothetical protein BH09VER1_BH09VER1_38290 [soil metagenome]
MILATAPRPRIITHRIGGLSAIHSSEVHSVIWKRDLAPQVRAESDEVSTSLARVIDFVTLPLEPEARVQQQLRKAKIESRFLAPDIALLINAFSELCRARRIRVRLGAQSNHAEAGDAIRLLCAYQRTGMRKRPSDGYVMIFRGSRTPSQQAPVDGFFLRLDAVPEKV